MHRWPIGRGTADALLRPIMKLRHVSLAILAGVAPSVSRAQPTPAAKLVPAAPIAAPINDELAAFDKDIDALFAAGGMTADQAAARAGAASPTVRRKAAEVEVAIAQAETAELIQVPQLSAKLAATKLSSLPALNLGGFAIAFPSHDYVATATLSVPLSDYLLKFPKLIDAARLGTETAKLSRRSSEISAGQDARLAYYELVRARLQVLVAQRSLAQVQATLGQVQALADNQRLSKADLMRVQSQEAQAEQIVDQLQNLADLREEQLRLLIGAGPEDKVTLGEDVRPDLGVAAAGSLEQMMGTAKQHRLEFKVLETGIAAKEKQRASEDANQYPKLSAFATGDYENPNPRVFPSEDKFKFTWAAGVQLTWSLNDTLVSRTKDRQLLAETDELRADRESLERGTRLEVLAAQQAVALAQHALTTTAKGLAAAQESYRVRRELLAAERATAVDLVDTETDLTRARIAALNARVDLRVAVAQLGHALGNDTK